MSDWSPFVQEARDGNFCGNRCPAMRCLSCGAGSKQCRQNLVGELFMGLLVVVLQKRGYIGIVDSTGVWHTSVSFEDYFNCTFLYVFDL